MKPLIFVSCGQCSEEEKRLGRNICALLGELRPDVEAYFADYQSTPEGLSDNVLKALNKAGGFICVMHSRGDIRTPDGITVTRGSLWIEQEIAITAFIRHALGRSLPTYFYKQADVSLEGIRSALSMNPRVKFTGESQVLEDLRSVLPSAPFSASSEYDLEPVVTCEPTGENGARHTYVLKVDVKNIGEQRVAEFLMQVRFPRAFLRTIGWAAENQHESNESHVCFELDQKRSPTQGLYPGKTLREPLTFEYFVDNTLYRDSSAMRSTILIELFFASKTKRKELNIKDYHKF